MNPIRLTQWRIVRHASATEHFNGRVEGTTRGRISTPIVAFDHAAMIGETRSGSVYELIGEPGHDVAADLVLAVFWMAHGGVDPKDISFIDIDDLDPLRIGTWIDKIQTTGKCLVILPVHTAMVIPSHMATEAPDTLIIELAADVDAQTVADEAGRPGSALQFEARRWLDAASEDRRKIEDRIRLLLGRRFSQ